VLEAFTDKPPLSMTRREHLRVIKTLLKAGITEQPSGDAAWVDMEELARGTTRSRGRTWPTRRWSSCARSAGAGRRSEGPADHFRLRTVSPQVSFAAPRAPRARRAAWGSR
jgi:hypothetical protein